LAHLKGSQTEKNILTAFAGESQARNRYTFFSKKAKKDGFVQIAQIFEETAMQEKAHASRLFKLLEGGEAQVTAAFPAGAVGETYDNLMGAAAGERYEYTEMYPGFARVARDEGFEVAAMVMEAIANAEKQHEKRYVELAGNIKADRVFKREQVAKWHCLNCGYIAEALEAPGMCPACAHPQAYFALLGENW
jgi:rubrerythrin